MEDNRSEAQRKQDDADAVKAMNDVLHSRPNKVHVSRTSTRDEANRALRRAAGRDEETDGGDAA